MTATELDEPQTTGRRWGSIHILIGLFVVSLVGHFVLLAIDTANDQALHGEAFEWGQYLVTWGAAVLENLQSEWAQLIVQGLLFSVLGERLFTASTETAARRHEELMGSVRDLRAEVRALATSATRDD